MPHNHLPDHHSIAIARNKFEDNLDEDLISNLIALTAKVGKISITINLITKIFLNFVMPDYNNLPQFLANKDFLDSAQVNVLNMFLYVSLLK